MNPRQSVIVSILEQFDELANPLWATSAGGSGGPALMPATYNASVREVERMLTRMRDDRHQPLIRTMTGKHSVRSLWWHLDQRYLKADRRLCDVRFVRGNPQGFVGKRLDENGFRPTVTPFLRNQQVARSNIVNWDLEVAENRLRRSQTPVDARVFVTTWHRDVQPLKVDLGVGWLCDHWTLAHEPFLPAETLAA